MPTKILIPVLLATLLFACGAPEPGSREAIEEDLKERTMTDLYAEVDKQEYTPPADGLLTDEHLKNYVKVRALGEKIGEAAGAKLDREIEEASRTEDRYTRLGAAFAGIGSARAAMTADLRAALMLGMNAQEHLWTEAQLRRARPVYQMMKRYDDEIAELRAARDAETDTILRSRKTDALERAMERKRSWESTVGDVSLANAGVVGRHSLVLGK
jgi:hypothetical protein